jgi:hypothetical protein
MENEMKSFFRGARDGYTSIEHSPYIPLEENAKFRLSLKLVHHT